MSEKLNVREVSRGTRADLGGLPSESEASHRAVVAHQLLGVAEVGG